MLIKVGTQFRVISAAPTAAGSFSQDGSVDSDSLIATLWVSSIAGGASLTVSVYTLTDTGRQSLLFTFPTLTSTTTNLVLKKAGVTMQRFLVVATYTGACSYEVYVRAIAGLGQSSSQLVGAGTWQVESASVTPTVAVLIPAALTDRSGLLIKNWGGTSNVFLGQTSAAAVTTNGYPLGPKDAVAMDLSAGAAVYACTDVGTADVRIVESGG